MAWIQRPIFVGISVESNAIGVRNKLVQDGIGNREVGQTLVPVFNGPLADRKYPTQVGLRIPRPGIADGRHQRTKHCVQRASRMIHPESRVRESRTPGSEAGSGSGYTVQ